jgi:hypothetical protein
LAALPESRDDGEPDSDKEANERFQDEMCRKLNEPREATDATTRRAPTEIMTRPDMRDFPELGLLGLRLQGSLRGAVLLECPLHPSAEHLEVTLLSDFGNHRVAGFADSLRQLADFLEQNDEDEDFPL